MSYIDEIHVFDDLKRSVEVSHLLYSFQISVSSVYQSLAVDVFEHPRFCDEFSYLVGRSLVPTISLCSSLTSMEKMFLTI